MSPASMNGQRSHDLRIRTREFALQVISLCASLAPSDEGRVIKRQLLKSGTSPGAHCREATRARSDAEMISKIETALRSWTRVFTGWNYWQKPSWRPRRDSSRS